jgi:hypothetical protein
MAERITSLPTRRVGGPRKYPWDDWTDGAAWRIARGVDFEVTPASMAGLVRKHALRSGLSVRAFVSGNAIEFQFAPASGSGEPKAAA